MSSFERDTAPSIYPVTGLTTGERLAQVGGIPDFWERVRRAPYRLLGVDYDGTLAPFRVARERATPIEGVKEALAAIRDLPGTSLAILSGRPAYQVMELLGRDLHVPVYGAHGFEVVHDDGTTEGFAPTEEQDTGLGEALAMAIDLGFGKHLEKKSASIALHTRGMSDPLPVELRFMQLWESIAERHNLSIIRFNRGVELRSQGHNKGTALEAVFRKLPPGTLPVYIGDDTTDEDAFHFVRTMGLGIKVGPGETEAVGHVSDEAAVLTILKDWPRTMAELRKDTHG